MQVQVQERCSSGSGSSGQAGRVGVGVGVGVGGAHWPGSPGSPGWVQMATVRLPTGTGAIGPGIARRGAEAGQWQPAKRAARGSSVRLGRLVSQCEWAVLH